MNATGYSLVLILVSAVCSSLACVIGLRRRPMVRWLVAFGLAGILNTSALIVGKIVPEGFVRTLCQAIFLLGGNLLLLLGILQIVRDSRIGSER